LQWVPAVLKTGTPQHAHVYLQIGAGILHAQPVAEPESPLGELSTAKFPFFIDEVINPDVFTIESWEVELSPMDHTSAHSIVD